MTIERDSDTPTTAHTNTILRTLSFGLGFISFVLAFTPGSAAIGVPGQIITNAALASIGSALIARGVINAR